MEMLVEHPDKVVGCGCLTIALGVIVGGPTLLGLTYCTKSTETFKIVDKYVKGNSVGAGEFYIVGENKKGEKEVFKNTDSFAFFKFDSADMQQQVNLGSTYKLDVNWMRVPFFSMYRNVLDVELVSHASNGNETAQRKTTLSPSLSLEAHYAGLLLNLINENEDADVVELIQAHTMLEAAKDPKNSTKIKVMGNKYHKQYMDSSTLEKFKQLLDRVAQGQSVVLRAKKNNYPVSFVLAREAYQRA